MTSPSRTPMRTCVCCNDDCHSIRIQLERELSQSREDALDEAARVAESYWQAMKDTEAAHYRMSGKQFNMLDFGFNPESVRFSEEAGQRIRSLKGKPAPIGDALDAARYRQLKSMPHTTCFDNHIWFQPSNFDKPINVKMIGHTELDNALDAAIRKGAE